MKFILYPNPDSETHLKVQVVDVQKQSTKTKYTSLVMKLFGGLLGALRNCTNTVFSLSGFGLCLLVVIITPSQAKPRDEASVFFVGHSLVNFKMPNMVHGLALDAGLISTYDEQIIVGSPLRYNWEHSHEAQGLDAKVALPTGDYNVFVMTESIPAHPDMVQYGGLFFNLAQTSNSNMESYYYEAWHWLHWGVGDADAIDYFNNFIEPNPAYHIPTPESNYDFRNQINISRPMWIERVDAMNQAYPQHSRMKIIPAGTALGQLYDAIVAGDVPGISQIDAVFEDNVHMNDIGNYFIALVHFATIYRRSPVGLTNELIDEFGIPFNPPTPAQAAIFQQIAWTAVQNYPRSGVSLIFRNSFEN